MCVKNSAVKTEGKRRNLRDCKLDSPDSRAWESGLRREMMVWKRNLEGARHERLYPEKQNSGKPLR